MTRVLLAEDDPAISEPLARALRREGYDVDVRGDGRTALEGARDNPDLVVLDLGLPYIDGLEVCRRIRAMGKTVPVLILTARADEVDTVVGLDAGADDYVTKPVGMGELAARIGAVLRRAAGPTADADGIVTIGALRLDATTRTVTVRDRPVHLTPREYEVLKVLVAHAGRLVTHARLLRAVWGADYAEEAHYVHVYVSQIRRKLAAADEDGLVRDLIVAEPGVGYRVARLDDAP